MTATIFFGATREAQLGRLATVKGSLKPNGALWIIRPKGRPEISERATMAPPTHTAGKFVIPLARRSAL